MNFDLKGSLLAFVILGVSSPVWSAPAENLMPTDYWRNNPLQNSAFFYIDDAKIKFDKNSLKFTGSSKDVTLFDPNHQIVPLKNEYFSMQATTNSAGSSATGSFLFGSNGGGGGYGIGSGVLFKGSITDVGWSNQYGLLEFAISNFSGKVCDLGWCSNAERMLFHTYSGKLGIVDKHGRYQSFSKEMEGIAVVPVPAAVWLFGSGLLALAGAARRRPALA